MTVLTPRQSEILGLMAAGLSNQEIADELGISVQTVKNWSSYNMAYRNGIFEQLGVTNRTAAIFEGARRGLVDVELSYLRMVLYKWLD